MKSIAATVLLLGIAFAADDLAALVRDLGSEDFASREAATRRLVEIGEPGRALLEAARSSPDAEVQIRAGRILAVLDARRQIDAECQAARKAFGGASSEDAARRLWLDVLYHVARGEDEELAGLFASGEAPRSFWESARNRPLSMVADLAWVEVIPSKRLGWMEFHPGDVVVIGALPEKRPDLDATPEVPVQDPCALVLSPHGQGWRARCALPDTASEQLAILVAQDETERREWAAGHLILQALGSKRSGFTCYGLAQALDAVGDFEAAIRAFERCQPTGQWPDYCIVHRYFDLMRLGRRGDAAQVLREEPGRGSCEYLLNVIRWLRGEMTTEALTKYSEDHGSYESESFYYYLGMERLIAGDVDRAREHLSRCATQAGGCYEQDFAADALWLLDAPEEETLPSGEHH